jgi:hypothetical protein
VIFELVKIKLFVFKSHGKNISKNIFQKKFQKLFLLKNLQINSRCTCKFLLKRTWRYRQNFLIIAVTYDYRIKFYQKISIFKMSNKIFMSQKIFYDKNCTSIRLKYFSPTRVDGTREKNYVILSHAHMDMFLHKTWKIKFSSITFFHYFINQFFG